MHSRTGLLRALAAATVLALAVGVPTASAATRVDKKQNKALKKQNKRIKKNKKGVRSGAKAIKQIKKAASATDDAIAAIKVIADRGDANAAFVLAAAPAIVDGLTQLQAGLVAAGAGLNSLKTLATSQEYGFGQVLIATDPGPPPVLAAQPGSFVVTPDIPDAVQQAQTTQTFVAGATGTLVVAYGVRSFESDGTGSANPAALCKVTVTNESGSTETTAANAGLGGLPFQPVDTKSVPTSTITANQGFPFGLKTEAPDADVTQNLVTSVLVTATESYTVGMSCVDTSPDPSDPSA